VNVQVGDRLADDVVDRYERPLSSQGIDQCTSDLLRGRQQRLHQALRQVQQRVDVLQRSDEDMALEDRSVIKERDHLVSTQDDRSLDIAAADLAEHVVGHRHETSAIGIRRRELNRVGRLSNISSIMMGYMSTPAYSPPGWPSQVRPPGAPGWEATAIAYLLDCCPADFRTYRVLRNHPIVLAQFALHFVNGQQEASERGLAEVRTSLGEYVEPDIVEAATQAWLEQGARLVRTRRAVALLEEALRGRVFVRKL
jgi:hypothetical protein